MLGRGSLLLALAAAAALPQCAGFAAFVPSPHALGTRAAALPRVAPPAALRGGSGVSGLRAQSMYQKIEEKLTAGLKPVKLTIVDNSHQHAGHAGVNGRECVPRIPACRACPACLAPLSPPCALRLQAPCGRARCVWGCVWARRVPACG